MKISVWKALLGLTVGGGMIGTTVSLHESNYDVNSLSIVRLGRAGITGFRIGMHYKQNLYNSSLDPESKEYEQLRSTVHDRAAKMLLQLCRENKGVYIKIGQHIGALDYLVPPEYVQVMKILHSKAPNSLLDDVYKVLREELKAEPSVIFKCFDPEPLGVASLAQVHRATLQDGTTVAVKVQHRLVYRNSISDMKTMELMVWIMSSIFKDLNIDWLVNETKRNLPLELDFRKEGENADKVRIMLSSFPWLKVPCINWNLTTKRVLTMEFVEGGQINDLKYVDKHSIDRMQVTTRLSELYAHMIFKHGFVHSDPHPGNILLYNKPGEQDVMLILLDHGLYANLSGDFRLNYSKLWLSILNRDQAGMKQHSEPLGILDLYPLLVCMVTGRSWQSINTGIDRVKYSMDEKTDFQKNVPRLLSKIADVLATVNREMLLILKTNDLLRGIEHSLKTEKRQPTFLIMTRCCVDNIYEEKILKSTGVWGRFSANVWKRWTLLKINLYNLYLNMRFMVGS